MEDSPFTEPKKRIIHRILQKKPDKKESLFMYAAYIFPSLLFAAYGMWNRDYMAVLVAYGALLILVLTYLNYTAGDSQALYSAIKKYEDAVGALQSKSDSEI